MATKTTIKRGDTGPAFRATLRDANGDAVNLSGATALFYMRDIKGQRTIKVSAGAMTIIDAPGGRVEYPWAAGDTDTAGLFDAEVQVTFGDGEVQTFPNNDHHRVEVMEDIS